METDQGMIVRIDVIRGAPCGATWDAVAHIIGQSPEEAIMDIGLQAQFLCEADPANWDPIYSSSPVHFAGEVHSAALKRALKKADKDK